MLGARSVALVGASARPGSFGERMITEARRGSARMYLVNPRYDRIGDHPCVPSLDALDETPDLVLMGVPGDVLVDQLAAAAAVGARSAVLFGSAHGDGLRAAITDIATRAGMAVCGAGCMGFVNNANGVRALGYLEPHPLPAGGIALVTHSGSAFSTLLRTRRGFGFRLAVSSGQELVTDTADYIDYALDDPGTRIIALLLETPRSVPRLRNALQRAAERDVPAVILTVGGSPHGRAMVAAHSGALAGDAAGWAAFCASTGAVRTADLAEFTDTLELFAAPRRSRGGGGIATVHDSGAERALCADIAHQTGVEFADLAEGTLASIGDLLDDSLEPSNPLDLWGTGADTRALFTACLRVMLEDPAVAVTALAVDLVPEFDGDTSYADAVLDVARHTREPLAVLASVPSSIDPVVAKLLRDNGIPVLEGMRSGLSAMAHLAAWPLSVSSDPVAIDRERRRRWRRHLTSKAISPFGLLADYGIAVTSSRQARSVEEALAAAVEIGYPVALKTTGVTHKSDVGGVVLDLADDAALAAAYDTMSATLGPEVTVDAMVAPGVELSVSLVRDEAFGQLIVVAAGGVTVELLGDRVIGCPPVSRSAARRMLEGLRIAPMLAGWRGAAPADIDALVDAVVGFSQMAIELGDVLDAAEANPVIASADGVIAVDALVIPRTPVVAGRLALRPDPGTATRSVRA